MVWIHPEDLPGMTVEVVEAPAVHESIILKLTGFECPRFESCRKKVVDLRLAFERQGGQLLGEPGRVRDLLLGERLEFCVREQHRVNIIRDYHAGCRLIGELLVELEAKLLKERHRALEVLHREVDENLPGHGMSPSIESARTPVSVVTSRWTSMISTMTHCSSCDFSGDHARHLASFGASELHGDDRVQDQPERDQHRWNERPGRVLHRFRAWAWENLQGRTL